MLTGENGILRQAEKAKNETVQSSESEIKKLTQAEANTYLEEYEYTDRNGSKVKIPAECAVLDTNETNTVEKGLVIIDKNGNEWVFIEVPKTQEVYSTSGLKISEFSEEECEKIYNDLKNYTKDYSDDVYSDIFYDDCGIDSDVKYEDLKNEILKSIYINGGFFIGRYETV